MNCQEALSLLYDIIDKESSEINTKEVKEHLDKCKHCFEVYRMEQSIQDFIDEKLADDQSPAKLDHLKNKILQDLNQIDTCSSAKAKNNIFKMPIVVIAAAASIVILPSIGVWRRALSNKLIKTRWIFSSSIQTGGTSSSSWVSMATPAESANPNTEVSA